MAQLLIEWDAEPGDNDDVHTGDDRNGFVAEVAHFVLNNLHRKNMSISADLSDERKWTYVS